MQTVKVNRSELLEKVKLNREAHFKEYTEAYQGYKEAVVAQLEQMLANAKKGNVSKTTVNLPVPQNHTREYDRAIAMLSMCVDSTIQLETHDFDRFVLDDWEWKEMTKMSFSTYLNKA